jgi:hypothetical protein
VCGIEGEPALDEAGDREGSFVAVELAVGEPRVVIDEGVHPLIADTHPLLGAGDVPVARDGMTRPAEADEALGVDVKQVTRTGPLIAAGLLTRLAGRPRDSSTTQRPPNSRMRMAGLSGDQPRPPTRAAPGRTDPLLLDRGQEPWTAMGTRGAILETSKRTTLLRRCL